MAFGDMCLEDVIERVSVSVGDKEQATPILSPKSEPGLIAGLDLSGRTFAFGNFGLLTGSGTLYDGGDFTQPEVGFEAKAFILLVMPSLKGALSDLS
ncbi:hypothetical protein TorRG33x02_339250 [Trema orientale]|uniref:Uncharacterized protein n=1 Tax=Trema orientale TaxID=63057 RepID=A0A2P5AWQ5_TREOI|nr:hypothetical protein TorRG33x02_339250 [Trema orientale]